MLDVHQIRQSITDHQGHITRTGAVDDLIYLQADFPDDDARAAFLFDTPTISDRDANHYLFRFAAINRDDYPHGVDLFVSAPTDDQGAALWEASSRIAGQRVAVSPLMARDLDDDELTRRVEQAAANGNPAQADVYSSERYRRATTPPAASARVECRCVVSCADDPATSCSLSGRPHVHPDTGSDTFGPCPEHPDADGDL